jgi:hypothetical protein
MPFYGRTGSDIAVPDEQFERGKWALNIAGHLALR